MLPGQEESKRLVTQVLRSTWHTLALFPRSKRAANRLTLFAQRGTNVSPRFEVLLLWRKMTQSKLIFDFDDAVFLSYPRGTRALCQAADFVFVANEFLAEYARRFSKKVFVLPTSIDLDVYRRPKVATSKPSVPVIGWIGTPSNFGYLRLLTRPLLRLRRSHDFVLTLITDQSQRHRLDLPEDLPLRIVPWTLDDFVENLTTFDVGVCPLPDEPWTRGKSGYKVLEYMALEIPPVASPVGRIADLITPGVDGVLAGTEEEWHAHLRELLENPKLRVEMGRAARKTVEARFSMDAVAREIVGHLDELDKE